MKLLTLADLHEYQTITINRAIRFQQLGIILDMGLGKTIIALTIINQLVKRGLIKKALIIAPTKVCYNVFRQEAQRWDHTKDFRIALLHGSNKKGRLAQYHDIALLNYDGINWFRGQMDKFRKKLWPYDCVIFDESTHIKNPSTNRFKRLKVLLPLFKYRYIMTGRPVPNSLLDIWSQYYALDLGEAWSQSYHQWRSRYFFPVDEKRFVWKPFQDTKRTLTQTISARCIKLSGAKYLKLPKLIKEEIPVILNPVLMKQYNDFKKEFYLSVNGQEVEVIAESAMGIKLRQYAQGFLYTGKDLESIQIHTEKLKTLYAIITPKPAIIVYYFRAELEGLQKLFPEALVVNGDTGEDVAQHTFDRWNAGSVSRLIVNSAAVSEGLNLQYGGHHIYWYTIPWSLTQWDQLNARLYRQGQKEDVYVYSLVAQGTKDIDVVKSLMYKNATQMSVLAALKGI